MNLFVSLVLSLGLQQPVVVPGCCPLATWVAIPLVVYLVPARPAPSPSQSPSPPARPQERLPHAAYL